MQTIGRGDKQSLYRDAFGNAEWDGVRGARVSGPRRTISQEDLGRGGVMPVHRGLHASRAAKARDGRRGVGLGVQTTDSDCGTLAPARLVAIMTSPALADQQVSTSVRTSRTPPARNH
jgi:hypothetical protein